MKNGHLVAIIVTLADTEGAKERSHPVISCLEPKFPEISFKIKILTVFIGTALRELALALKRGGAGCPFHPPSPSVSASA